MFLNLVYRFPIRFTSFPPDVAIQQPKRGYTWPFDGRSGRGRTALCLPRYLCRISLSMKFASILALYLGSD